MGKYDGILLLTDFDGTLYTGREIPEANIKAIRHFCAEGGRFGLSTGRTYKFFEKFEDQIVLNTYISSINGTVVYDYPNKRIVSESFVGEDMTDKVREICERNERLRNVVIFRRDIVEGLEIDGSREFYDSLSELMSNPVYKVMFHSRERITDREKLEIDGIIGESYFSSRSWAEGIELQRADSTKGDAAKLIKRLSGADLLVCAGDFENDITMIKAADIGYAVGNALDSVKAAADRVLTARVEDGAIAAIINELGSV